MSNKETGNFDWWTEGVIYQIYPRSFMDASGDGIGDLRGIIDRLDYLNDGTEKSLGIDAIWLSPIFLSPMLDFGYDVSDYSDIDPIFGSISDFDELLSEAHKRNIKIILDFVPNHTSHLHEWFIESRNSIDNPKRDWYIWEPPKGGGWSRPNNWQSVFGGPAWEWDEKTQEFYYHHFLPEQPDINWRNPKLREAIYGEMSFWLDRGVDGFRLDVINHIFKDKNLRNNPYTIGRRPYDMQKHIYDKDLHDENLEVVREMRALVDGYGKKGERMLVGEVFIEDPHIAKRYYGDGRDGLNLAFYFKFSYMPFKARSFCDTVSLWEDILPEGAWPTYFLSNHDQPRHIGRYAKISDKETEARAKVAATMLLTLRGTPFLYYGEEIGMMNLHINRRDLKDPVGIRYWPIPVGRDLARTPMQWDETKYAGFTKSHETWLPIHPNHETVNVKTESSDPSSLLSFYRNLIWTRKRNSPLRRGSIKIIKNTPEGIFSYLREYRGEILLIVLNFKKREYRLSRISTDDLNENVKSNVTWEIILSTHRDAGEIIGNTQFKIKPYEATILKA